MSLKSSIRQAEQRIAERRSRLSSAINGITDAISKRMVSPGVLVTAGLFGAALHRDHRTHGLRLLALLKTANAGQGLVRTLAARAKTAAAESP